MFYDLVQNLVFNSNSSKKQIGGGSSDTYSSGTVFFTMLAVFIIKVLLVMISYNILGPRMLEKWGKDPSTFRPITFVEGIFIVILFNNLFTRF